MTAARVNVVLVLPVLEPAGAERIVAELALRLPAHGFATSVVCLEDETAPVGREIAAAGVPVAGLGISRRRTLAASRALAARLPEGRPLLVHAHLFHANLAARLAIRHVRPDRRAGVHVLATVHICERRFRPWQFLLDQWTAPVARVEVCVSRAVARFQKKRTGLPESFFRVIENGIDLSRFRPCDRRGDPLVLSAGRLDPQKDYPTLLRAWKIVESAHPTARLAIAGEGPERPRLEGMIRAFGLSRASLLGHVADIPGLLATGAVYAQLSAWEGFGLAVAEAMASALPVVVSDADSLPELVSHRRTGLVVPKRDPAAAARAILDLLADPALAARLGEAARAEALSRFAVEKMVAEYATLYRNLTSR
ncbi:MAG: glycosyltransferase [Planctomycetes bacterium]|nr:glycosyltransferase [Planctomycetota bacterium]